VKYHQKVNKKLPLLDLEFLGSVVFIEPEIQMGLDKFA
jgi:hypothetical protein